MQLAVEVADEQAIQTSAEDERDVGGEQQRELEAAPPRRSILR
jgi:hypothetical protein